MFCIVRNPNMSAASRKGDVRVVYVAPAHCERLAGVEHERNEQVVRVHPRDPKIDHPARYSHRHMMPETRRAPRGNAGMRALPSSSSSRLSYGITPIPPFSLRSAGSRSSFRLTPPGEERHVPDGAGGPGNSVVMASLVV